MQLNQRAFSIWNSDAQAWTTLDGNYTVHVGDSSASLPLSAPVTVAKTVGVQPVTVSAPSVLATGQTATVTTTLGNTGDYSVSDATVQLSAPPGWQVTPASATLGTVDPGGHVATTWQVTAPADATPGNVQLTASATYNVVGIGGPSTSTGTATVAVPYPQLSAAFGNVGITDDSNTNPGNIDGSGSSFSAQALAAQGVTAGSAVSVGGFQFRWPDAAAGQPDNVLAAGQPITLSGSGSTLGFLLAGTYGPVSGNGTVIYTDGTTQSYTVTAPDWYSAPSGTGDVAITTPYRNRQGNTQDAHAVKVFYASVPLQAGKTVAAVVLPNVGSTVASGTPLMHIFGLGIG
jgi:beta-glucosidase